jgi:hypothetical protein
MKLSARGLQAGDELRGEGGAFRDTDAGELGYFKGFDEAVE